MSPGFARNMSRTVLKGGGAFLDAPISGGPQGALEGRLILGPVEGRSIDIAVF